MMSFTGYANEINSGEIERCLSNYCFDKNRIVNSDLIKVLGEGYTRKGKSKFNCYVQSINNKRVYYQFMSHHDGEVRSLFVSYLPNCIKSHTPGRKIASPSTRLGLKLGDNVDKLLQILGSPEFIGNSTSIDFVGVKSEELYQIKPFGEKMYVYGIEGDVLHNVFYISKGKIIGMKVSSFP